MKTTLYRALYHVFLFLSKHFDNRFLTSCKLLAASGLFACTSGCRQQANVAPRLSSAELSPSIIGEVEVRRGTPADPRDTLTEEEKAQIFCYVKEEMPRFPGGDAALLRFIRAHTVYPEEARKLGLEGRVIVSMMIDTLGRAVPYEVIRGIHPLLDSVALDIVRQMPRWTPGGVLGRKVAVKYTIPVTFRLEKDSLTEKTEGR